MRQTLDIEKYQCTVCLSVCLSAHSIASLTEADGARLAQLSLASWAILKQEGGGKGKIALKRHC